VLVGSKRAQAQLDLAMNEIELGSIINVYISDPNVPITRLTVSAMFTKPVVDQQTNSQLFSCKRLAFRKNHCLSLAVQLRSLVNLNQLSGPEFARVIPSRKVPKHNRYTCREALVTLRALRSRSGISTLELNGAVLYIGNSNNQ
jgi:hypothetical protein